MISRLITDRIRKSPKSVLLLGPRQVGKSSLILSLKPDLVINLHDDRVYLDFKSNPNELRELIEGQKPKVVFLDEIQRDPALLNMVQVLLDSPEHKGNLKFYITGSSARKLRRGQANLLPGRILSFEIGPLCAAELNYKLDVQRALKFGCLPDHLNRSKRKSRRGRPQKKVSTKAKGAQRKTANQESKDARN